MADRTLRLPRQALLRLARAKPPVIASFHASWAPGHNSTDYERYYSLPPGSEALYKVEEYQSAYEPYVITSKRVSWCVSFSVASLLGNEPLSRSHSCVVWYLASPTR